MEGATQQQKGMTSNYIVHSSKITMLKTNVFLPFWIHKSCAQIPIMLNFDKTQIKRNGYPPLIKNVSFIIANCQTLTGALSQ